MEDQERLRVIWDELRPNMEESEVGLRGVRNECLGVRMEVRLLHTVEAGLHALWKVASGPFFYAAGIIPVTQKKPAKEAFDDAMGRAALLATVWIKERKKGIKGI